MSEDKTVLDQICQCDDILEFFASANANLVRKKLERYGLVDEGIRPEIHTFTVTVGATKLNKGIFVYSRGVLKNPITSKLKIKRCLKRSSI
jgi:hypothetical protein